MIVMLGGIYSVGMVRLGLTAMFGLAMYILTR